jgi:ABC-type multidrug transport system fused ATPase/permease subunit
MPQDVYLFNTTLRDNLLLADADRTDEELLGACRTAQLGDFVDSLPEGLDTRIGEDGVRLSGGERQRLALARALIKRAPIVILDEPTANLDAETERRLVASLRGALAGSTVILISHRPAVWAIAGRVIAIESGRAVAVEATGRERTA